MQARLSRCSGAAAKADPLLLRVIRELPLAKPLRVPRNWRPRLSLVQASARRAKVRVQPAALVYRYRDAQIVPRRHRHERPTTMLREVMRDRRAAAVGDWSDPPLPETVEARHRIARTLILLALMGLLGTVVSLLAK